MVARNTYVKTAAGWEQIATTIQAIPQGLVPIVPTSVTNGSTTGDGQISFSATTSVSLNGVFSATYDSYLVILDITTTSAATAVNFRMRAAGTDNSTASSYLTALTGITTGGTSVNIAGATTQSTFTYLPTGYAYGSGEFIFTDPFAASVTKVALRSGGTDSGYGSYAGRSGTVGHTQATSYDGVTFYGTANLTGTIRVYGYSKGGINQPQTITPYSMSAGLTGAIAAGGSATVTFPASRFSVAPIITATSVAASSTNGGNPNITGSSTTGFTIYNTSGATRSFYWNAIQMTSSAAAG